MTSLNTELNLVFIYLCIRCNDNISLLIYRLFAELLMLNIINLILSFVPTVILMEMLTMKRLDSHLSQVILTNFFSN